MKLQSMVLLTYSMLVFWTVAAFAQKYHGIEPWLIALIAVAIDNVFGFGFSMVLEEEDDRSE